MADHSIRIYRYSKIKAESPVATSTLMPLRRWFRTRIPFGYLHDRAGEPYPVGTDAATLCDTHGYFRKDDDANPYVDVMDEANPHQYVYGADAARDIEFVRDIILVNTDRYEMTASEQIFMSIKVHMIICNWWSENVEIVEAPADRSRVSEQLALSITNDDRSRFLIVSAALTFYMTNHLTAGLPAGGCVSEMWESITTEVLDGTACRQLYYALHSVNIRAMFSMFWPNTIVFKFCGAFSNPAWLDPHLSLGVRLNACPSDIHQIATVVVGLKDIIKAGLIPLLPSAYLIPDLMTLYREIVRKGPKAHQAAAFIYEFTDVPESEIGFNESPPYLATLQADVACFVRKCMGSTTLARSEVIVTFGFTPSRGWDAVCEAYHEASKSVSAHETVRRLKKASSGHFPAAYSDVIVLMEKLGFRWSRHVFDLVQLIAATGKNVQRLVKRPAGYIITRELWTEIQNHFPGNFDEFDNTTTQNDGCYHILEELYHLWNPFDVNGSEIDMTSPPPQVAQAKPRPRDSRAGSPDRPGPSGSRGDGDDDDGVETPPKRMMLDTTDPNE